MTDTMGPPSFLPTIKCSSCGKEIEISMMGDHICSQPAPTVDVASAQTPPPEALGTFSPTAPQTSPKRSVPSFSKPTRVPPPRVDTGAANRPFLRTDPMTPLSASPNSGAGNPLDGRRSLFPRPQRSATAPLRGPPSPEPLSSNMDNPFPPFPMKKKELKKENKDMYAPMSPRVNSNGGLLQRMNTIAPGPFDMRKRRPSIPKPISDARPQETSLPATVPPLPSSAPGTAISEPAPVQTATTHAPKLSISAKPVSSTQAPIIISQSPPGSDTGSETMGNRAMGVEPLRPESRSMTFPRLELKATETEPNRPATAGASRPFPSELIPRGPASGPDRSRAPPPRGASLSKGRVPGVNLEAEFGAGNPYHTPSDSQSSDASGYSEQSKASSRSSPPRTSSKEDIRTTSESNISSLMSEIQSSMANLTTQDLPPSTAETDKSKNQLQVNVPGIQTWNGLESPTDPAIMSGRLSPNPVPPVRANTTPVAAPLPSELKPKRRATASKGDCKSCGNAITGKSVSSADGRLTGRYHKQCFVCTTCRAPFTTATFYVIDDAPYCERDYHRLNGSMCRTCDRGIEGQYLETQRRQKFHPHCLTCADCHRILRDDYFEMGDKVYCERDAWRRAQQTRFLGPGATNRMERRTTRLMMM